MLLGRKSTFPKPVCPQIWVEVNCLVYPSSVIYRYNAVLSLLDQGYICTVPWRKTSLSRTNSRALKPQCAVWAIPCTCPSRVLLGVYTQLTSPTAHWIFVCLFVFLVFPVEVSCGFQPVEATTWHSLVGLDHRCLIGSCVIKTSNLLLEKIIL